MQVSMDPHEGIRVFADSISRQPLGLAIHSPEKWALPMRCFENVFEKVRRDGGAVRVGWTFHYRIAPGVGEYLFATHHAVWHAPNGSLIDVTPFHEDEKHHPLTPQDGNILFLVDDAAQRVETETLIAPLPLQYFPLSDDQRLLDLIQDYRRKEELECREIYESRENKHQTQ
jgi:hypothetical protein